jgi:hypothetical protein
MLGQASNPMLAQAEEGIVAKVPENLKASFEKVVHAGLTIMYSPKLEQQLNQRIASSSDPAKEAAEGAARMMSNLYQQSGKKLPIPLVIPAAMVFGFEWLDLVAKAGKADITPDLIAQTTQAIADSVLPMMGITKDKLAQLVAQSQSGGAQQPAGAPSAPQPSAGIIGTAQAGA